MYFQGLLKHTSFPVRINFNTRLGELTGYGINYKETDQLAAEKLKERTIRGREDGNAGKLMDNFVDQNGWGREDLV